MPLDSSISVALICLAQGGSGLVSMLPLVLLMGLGYALFVLPQQKKDRAYREMIANLKEKDHVLTSAGIFGVVTNIQRDQDRVTIRIDETNGTKIRIATWAISDVITDDKSGGPPPSAKDSKK